MMNKSTRLCYGKNTVTIQHDGPTVIIGKRINPTGRKIVLAALQAGDFEIVRQDAIAQWNQIGKALYQDLLIRLIHQVLQPLGMGEHDLSSLVMGSARQSELRPQVEARV